MTEAKKYRAFTLNNFRKIPEVRNLLSEEERHEIEVVGNVLPFKVNNYVVEKLIDWENIPEDPIYQLTFPQRGMLSDAHFKEMENALQQNLSNNALKLIADNIRYQLNPHPDGQQQNIPFLDGIRLTGIQHKYRETVLFFPRNGQTCHAYCSFCFRWPQFVSIDELKFAMRETELLVRYLKKHPEVTDVLFTGGDPMVMSTENFAAYVEPLIQAGIANLQTIRIGTKALSYWPYRFLTDKDADDMLRLFEAIVKKGYNLAFMAHFNHPRELHTPAVQKAIQRILCTGSKIRTQSPVMKHINDSADDWRSLWMEQISLGCIPYYMFIARDTGAQGYFAVELERAWDIFRQAYQSVSGIARTVRGPSMSTDPGKVQILGVNEIMGEKVFALRFIQGRDPGWVGKPFFAKYNPYAVWIDDLMPAFDRTKFFFEEEEELERNHILLN